MGELITADLDLGKTALILELGLQHYSKKCKSTRYTWGLEQINDTLEWVFFVELNATLLRISASCREAVDKSSALNDFILVLILDMLRAFTS